MKKILLFFLLIFGLFSKEITLDYLQKKPQGIVRDFYIWYFISQDKTNIDEAKEAYNLVFRKTPRIENAMIEKGVISQMPRDIFCKKLDFDLLKQEDAQCIASGLKLNMIPTLPKEEVDFLLSVLQSTQQDLYQQILILRSDNVLDSLLKTTPKNFADIFNALSYVQKVAIIDNKNLDSKALLKLLNANYAPFNRAVATMILDSKFNFVKKALNQIEVSQSDTNTFFLLGINALLLDNPQGAISYFAKSQKSAIDPFMQDRALFWQYLVSKKEEFLRQLSQSTFVDIFSIYANQKLQTAPKYQIISEFDILQEESKIDIKNPFQWQQKRSEIIKLNGKEYEESLKQFYHKETLPHLVFFLSRQYRYDYNYFIFAYDDPKIWKNNDEKAMAYAVARQESHLLPALVSSSYALGMMQIMPFNVAPFAKEMQLKNISLFDMFDPKIALKFGTFYLNELQREFKHPLFVAYAYNGGPGFLRRTLARNRLFLKNRNYEPWISMELLPYEESRFYGMKVIANYLIYAQILGKTINVEDFLNKTIQFEEGKK